MRDPPKTANPFQVFPTSHHSSKHICLQGTYLVYARKRSRIVYYRIKLSYSLPVQGGEAKGSTGRGRGPGKAYQQQPSSKYLWWLQEQQEPGGLQVWLLHAGGGSPAPLPPGQAGPAGGVGCAHTQLPAAGTGGPLLRAGLCDQTTDRRRESVT